jgi:aspartate aminotransferase
MKPRIPSVSPSLAAAELIRARIAAGRDVVQLASGDSGLPLHPLLEDELARGAAANSYGPVGGPAELREAIAGYFSRRALATPTELVLATPGTKAGLFLVLVALPGEVYLPRPSWSTYEPQAGLAGKRCIRVPTPPGTGGVPDPGRLDEVVRSARSAGRTAGGILVLTVPDNPTGAVASAELIGDVLTTARKHGLAVVSDEMYRDLVYGGEPFASPAELDPENVVVTAGPSKSVALSGWRIGAIRFPETRAGREWLGAATAVASEIWSCLSAPVARAARLAFDEPDELRRFTASARVLYASTTLALHERLAPVGASCPRPQAAFFLYPSLAERRDYLRRAGMASGADLARVLLERFDVGTLPGEAFGDAPEAFALRLTTSALYGSTDDERWEALRLADSPALLELPRLREAFARVEKAFAELGGLGAAPLTALPGGRV